MERKAFGFEFLGGESQVEVLLGEFEIEVCEHLDNIDDMPLQHADGFAYSPVVILHANGSYVCWSSESGLFYPHAGKDGVRVICSDDHLQAFIDRDNNSFIVRSGFVADEYEGSPDCHKFSAEGREKSVTVKQVKELLKSQVTAQ